MKRILVVDDNRGILDALRMALTMLGNEVQCQMHATNVTEDIQTFQPDILILDLLLSGENGADICSALKADARFRYLPIVMMSAHPSAKKVIFAAGADDFLPKPFDLQYLVDIVKKY